MFHAVIVVIESVCFMMFSQMRLLVVMPIFFVNRKKETFERILKITAKIHPNRLIFTSMHLFYLLRLYLLT